MSSLATKQTLNMLSHLHAVADPDTSNHYFDSSRSIPPLRAPECFLADTARVKLSPRKV
jgi:hypothetical protein